MPRCSRTPTRKRARHPFAGPGPLRLLLARVGHGASATSCSGAQARPQPPSAGADSTSTDNRIELLAEYDICAGLSDLVSAEEDGLILGQKVKLLTGIEGRDRPVGSHAERVSSSLAPLGVGVCRYRPASRRRRGPVALRPRLSPGVPLSRDGKQELRVGTGDVNKASGAREVWTPPY